MKEVEISDEVRQNETDGPVAYMVFTFEDDLHEYKLFTDQREAVDFANDCAERSKEDWPIYPLWAGHAATENELSVWN